MSKKPDQSQLKAVQVPEEKPAVEKPSPLSRIRLSLTLRIAMHYSVQLIRSFIPVLLLTSLLFWVAVFTLFRQDTAKLIDAPLSVDGAITLSVLDDAEVTCLEAPDNTTTRIAFPDPAAVFTEHCLIVEAVHTSGTMLLIRFSLERSIFLYWILVAALLLADAYRMLYFVLKRKRLLKNVLAPIRDMTELAATLSANNLSNRINIAGTKNELQDLAIVINSMLDRIETSYNSQKQFVSDASHELRTPIAVIQGYANMLARWGKSDPAILDEAISAISQETESMKQLVEELLFLARHDKKTLLLETIRFDVLDVAAEVQSEAAMVTPENTFLLSPSDHVEIEADRKMIKQVLRILCDNAIKYSPKGGTITIGVAKTDTGCTLSMSDQGIGIAKEELPKIFERFYRSDSARKSETGGHGLGLSIARIIVMGHGGQLRVRSKVGAGTTFFVDLPTNVLRNTNENA